MARVFSKTTRHRKTYVCNNISTTRLKTARRPFNNIQTPSTPSNNRPKTVQRLLNTFNNLQSLVHPCVCTCGAH
eukprot:16441169-Heterocapsa_arctica.AAC.1